MNTQVYYLTGWGRSFIIPLIFFFLTCIFSSELILAQTTWTIGSGATSNTSTTIPAPFANSTKGTRQQYVYKASELTAAGMTGGLIHKFGFNVIATNSCGILQGFSIKMRNSATSNLTAFQGSMTTVLNSFDYTPVAGWNVFTLDNPFTWDGSTNIIVEICFYSSGTATFNASTEWTTGLTAGISRTLTTNSNSGICGLATGAVTSTSRPNARFVRNPQSYTSSTTVQASTSGVVKGSNDSPIISVQVVMSGSDSPLNLTQFNFNTSGSSNASGDITTAKVYYSGTTNTFSTSTLFGSFSQPNGSFNITGTQALANGTNYFWLTYDISSGATTSNTVDAQCTQITVGGNAHNPSETDPAGSRTIIAPANPVIIGSGTGSNGSQEYPAPFGNFYTGARHQFIYLASELSNAGFSAGAIDRLGFNVTAVNGCAELKNLTVKLGNTSTGAFVNAYITGTSAVYGPTDYQPVDGWNTLEFTSSFTWDGVSNVVVEICFNNYTVAVPQNYTSNASTEWTDVGFNASRYRNIDNSANVCSGTNSSSNSTFRPNIKFERNSPQSFNSVSVIQPDTSTAIINSSAAIIAVQVDVSGTLNPLTVSQLNFNTTGSTDPSVDIINARVYYTGTSNTFSTTTLFGSSSLPNGVFNISGAQTLSNGTNYFWLAYEIASGAVIGHVVDAQCTQVTVEGIDHVPPVPSPAGSRTINTGPSSVIIGTGTGSNASNIYPAPFGNYYMGARHQFIYRASEIMASGFTGSVERFGFNVLSVNGAGVHQSFTIKMKNSSTNELTGFETGMTQVLNPVDYQPVAGWNMFDLDTPFNWDGVSNIIVDVCFYTAPENAPPNGYTFNASTEWTTNLGPGTSWYLNNDNQSDICGATTGTNAPQSSTSRPNAKFARNSNQVFSSATVIQPNLGAVPKPTTNAQIIAVKVEMSGNLSPLNITQLNFNTTGSTNPTGDISAAKVYYTGNASSFSTATQFGSTVNSPNGPFNVTGAQLLEDGTNYFWLAYDIPSGAVMGNSLDAQCTQITINGNNIIPAETNPLGTREIAPADTLYARYDPNMTGVNSANPFLPTAQASYLSASGLTMVGATDFSTDWAYYTYNWPASFNAGKYIYLTITPDPTHHVRLRSLDVYLSADANTVQTVPIRTSIDNYTADVGTININTAANTYINYSVNLSALPESTDPVTIRLYPYGGSGNRQLMIYNVPGLSVYGFEVETTPLPVELSTFTVSSERLNATLKWETATEVNNFGFEIERRLSPTHSPKEGALEHPFLGRGHGEGWEKAGFVKGNGNSNTAKKYEYKDKNLSAGKYLYRLKQINSDGTFEYSDEIEIEVGTAPLEFKLAQNYPNPFNPETMIEFTVPETRQTTLKVYDILGAEVKTLFDQIAEAGIYHQVRFNGSDLATGIYIARLQFGNKQMMKKMLMIK